MKEIKCPKCGQPVNDELDIVCPHCSEALTNTRAYKKRNLNGGAVAFIATVCFGFISYLCFFNEFEADYFWGTICALLSVLGMIGLYLDFAAHKKYRADCELARSDYSTYVQKELELNAKEKEIEDRQQEYDRKRKEEKDRIHYNNYKYTCPMCGSHKVVTLRQIKKAISVEIWGTGSSTVGKNYQCYDCKYMW